MEGDGQLKKRLALTGNFYVDPLEASLEEMAPAHTQAARPPRAGAPARSRRGSEEGDDDNVPVRRAPAVVTTQKSMSLSGNYYISTDHSELEHERGDAGGEDSEADAERLLAAERGLLPLDVAWFLNVFTRFDHDRSGTISAAELGDVLRFLGQNPLNFEVEQMVRAAAVYGDGQIRFAAFLRLMELLPAPGDVIEECFRVFDQDGTGLISRDELSSVLLTQGETLSSDEFEAMMEFADKNGDGQIDYREFAALLTGSSGKVTQEKAQITDLDIVMAVQEARAHGYDRIKRAVGKGGIRSTEYISPSLDLVGAADSPVRAPYAAADALDADGTRASEDGRGELRGELRGEHAPFQLDLSTSPDRVQHLAGVRVELQRTTNGTGLLLGTGQALRRMRVGAVRPPLRTAEPLKLEPMRAA